VFSLSTLRTKNKLKNIVLRGLPVLSTIAGTLLKFSNGIIGWVFASLLIVTTLSYLILSSIYTKKEENLEEKVEALTMEVDKHKMQSKKHARNIAFMVKFLDHLSKGINDTANGIKEEGAVLYRLFETDTFVEEICYTLKQELAKDLELLYNSNSVQVGYINVFTKGNNRIMYMSGHSSSTNKPSFYRKKVNLDTSSSTIPAVKAYNYYIAQKIRDEDSDITIFMDETEILRNFYTANNEDTKYSQYILYPLFCEDNKLLGFLEVVLYDECILRDDEKKMMLYIIGTFEKYASLIMIIYKAHKGLLAKPKVIDGMKKYREGMVVK
jgi:ribosomal protein L23